jgi:hypothetical protein
MSNMDNIELNRIFETGYLNYKLGRQLDKYELKLLHNVNNEYKINKKIRTIFEFAQKDNLYIPFLTNMYGNCIFESIKHYGIIDDIEKFRSGLAIFMLIFKDTSNFIPNQELSLSELFGFYNDVEIVYCKKQRKLYKYNYDAMCVDLSNDTSWTRLNTELIFTAMTVFLNIKFKIYHDNGHISVIETLNNEDTMTINLGLINEIHYIPLANMDETISEETKCLIYRDEINQLFDWLNSESLVA